MQVALESPCKVNFILNILGRRPDGFHELETIMHPVPVHDLLTFERRASGIELACDHPALPTGPENLVYRAAATFLQEARITDGVKIHLSKRIPLAAGLGGGSGNAATTLLGLNQLFDRLLSPEILTKIAAQLGSDVPFFLQDSPALATGRGEQVQPLPRFRSLDQIQILLIHPGFGVSTPWAYKNLARFPEALNGRAGQAERLAQNLSHSLAAARTGFYNSLEAPVLEKYPILALFQEFLRENGAAVAMMSGSGSTTFALIEERVQVEGLAEGFRSRFGDFCWMRSALLNPR